MINILKRISFAVCIILVFTAQSRRPEDTQQPEKSGRPVSRAPVVQHAPNVQNNQPRPQVEQPKSTPQVIHRPAPAPQVVHRAAPQTHVTQPIQQQRTPPRVYAVASPASVTNNQFLHRQHHKYWHPSYNFYEHQYRFYPYVNVASTVEFSPECVQVLFNGQIYYYDHWTFYIQEPQGYLAVPPPIGAIVPTISKHAVQVIVNGEVYFNHNNLYYQPVAQGYQVVEPPGGAISINWDPVTLN